MRGIMYMAIDNKRALVALPVILAVLLVALSMPAQCAFGAAPAKAKSPIGPLAAGPVPAAQPAEAHAHGHTLHTAANEAHHATPAPVPASQRQPLPQPMSSDNCEHSIPTVLQPAPAVEQVKALDAAPAAVLPVPAPAVALAVLVDERPSDPPGVTLNASHLRI